VRAPASRRGFLAGAAVVVVAVGLVTWRRGSAWKITNASPTGTQVIAFGDSLTAGYRLDPGQSYPDQLSRLIGRPVLNRGVSGDTTGDALGRLERDVLAEDPRVVVVCLGGNDMLRRLPPDRQFDNLREIVRRIQDRGALVVLVGTEGFRLLSEVDYGARYRELARETGAVYVEDFMDGVLGDPRLMYDQIHPNAAGYEKIARRLAGEAGEYLRR
jgi:acyl-CoA thioesterase-1